MKFVWIGYLATALSALSLVPSVYTAVVKKSVHSTSYAYLVIGMLGQIFWLIYGYNNRDWPIASLAMYLIFVFTTIGVAKAYYEANKKDVLSKAKLKCTVR